MIGDISVFPLQNEVIDALSKTVLISGIRSAFEKYHCLVRPQANGMTRLIRSVLITSPCVCCLRRSFTPRARTGERLGSQLFYPISIFCVLNTLVSDFCIGDHPMDSESFYDQVSTVC